MENDQNKRKIRPFDLRDLLFIQRLQEVGQVLDYERAQVDGVSPRRDAFYAYVRLGTGSGRTLVMSDRSAFVQYVCHKDSKKVGLTFLAPAPTRPEYADSWLDLLEQLAAVVGAQGVHHIVAEAVPDGPEFELLRRTGFGVFARQVLFRLASPPPSMGKLPQLPGLRLWRPTDGWGVRLLYANTVPQLAQQIEAPAGEAFNTSLWPQRLVLARQDEVIAYLATRRGRVGNAMRLLLHPEAEGYVKTLIRHGLATLAGGPSLPVYCRVRRYESWLGAPLEACGFEPVSQTVLLVKHIVARVMTPEWHQMPVLEGRAEMTTPVAQARLRKP